MINLNTTHDVKIPKCIAIDFDSTCVFNTYPSIGDSLPGAVDTLKELVAKGHKLVLFTMREYYELTQAIQWFTSNGIPLYGVQRHPRQKNFNEVPDLYFNTPKPRVDLFIDDRNLGIPLIDDGVNEPYVDWEKCKEFLKKKNYL